jgi:hypothetical protein
MATSKGHIGRVPLSIAAVVVLVLLVAHLAIAYFAVSRTAVALDVSGTAILLIAVKHVGIVGGVLSRLRRRRRGRKTSTAGTRAVSRAAPRTVPVSAKCLVGSATL